MPSPPGSLSARKREITRHRLASVAAQLVGEGGLAGVTVEHIAERAGVGRATFFRYFRSKEDAIAEGMTAHWLDRITAAVAEQPPGLSAADAVIGAFENLAGGFGGITDQVRDLATLTRSSPALNAWTLQVYVRYENAIAALVAPRFPDPRQDDLRPRLIGACAMAAVRIALDDWLAYGGSLPERVQAALRTIRIS
jgi:AcrR family transcriptional regulator